MVKERLKLLHDPAPHIKSGCFVVDCVLRIAYCVLRGEPFYTKYAISSTHFGAGKYTPSTFRQTRHRLVLHSSHRLRRITTCGRHRSPLLIEVSLEVKHLLQIVPPPSRTGLIEQ